MSVFKSEFTRAIKVIATADAVIPSPNVIVKSTAQGTSTNQLIDDNVNFIKLNVQAGDIVYNVTSPNAATVVSVLDDITLELNADIIGSGDEYIIYQQSSQTGLGNTGCYLMPFENTSMTIVTIGGDEIQIDKALAGAVLPIQVLQLKVIGSGNAIALW